MSNAATSDSLAVPQQILWEDGVENAYPRWSNDGSRILFQSNRTGTWQVYIMNRDGSGLTRVTDDRFNNNFVDWSPDNQLVAFVSDRDGNEEIYLCKPDGSGLRRLTNNPERDIHPYFAPDGKSLLFNSTRDNPMTFEVYSINLDGTNEKRLTRTDEVETCARYSTDMSQVVLLRADFNDEVYVVDPTFASWTNITNSPSAEGWPSWSPDGKQVIYSNDESGTFSLYLINADGSNRRRLTYPKSFERDARANISPDGKTVVFNRQVRSTIGIYLLPLADE